MRRVSVLDAIEAGDHEEACARLLERWRIAAQPEIADALDLVSAKLTRPPIPGDSAAERHAEWLAIAAQRDPADVPRLVRGLLDGTSAAPVQARIEVLVERGRDPRVATALVDIVKAQVVFVSKPKFWRAVLDGIDAMRDVRQIQALIDATPTSRNSADSYILFDLQTRLATVLPKLVAKLRRLDIPPISKGDRERVDAVIAKLGTRRSSEEQLLDAVLADPDDDAARLVYADALIARGDGRGELIVAQIQKARGEKVAAKHEDKLLRTHKAAVLGPLAPVVCEPVIERGFLTRCRTVFQFAQLDLVAHPWWRTVIDLTTERVDLATREDLRIERLEIVDNSRAIELMDDERPLPIRTLNVPTPKLLARIPPPTRFPALTTLELDRNGREDRPAAVELASLWKTALGKQLVEVVVRSRLYDVPLELDAWRKTKLLRVRYQLPYMSAVYEAGTLAVELRGGGALTALGLRLEILERRPRVVITKAPKGVPLGELT
jgi:uncharacterized protein (TIGR02996 family)